MYIVNLLPHPTVTEFTDTKIILLFTLYQVYVVVGIAGVALTGCVLMVIILKYGRNSKFGIKGKLYNSVCIYIVCFVHVKHSTHQ